jgi:hypothetical protein
MQFYPTVHFVSLSSAAPVSPFTNWMTAATNIQDAIDAANAGDLVLVSNGIYTVGGRAVYGLQTNRVTIDQPITVQALAGANYTAIAGTFNGPRCVYLTNGAVLLGFTLTNGGARFSGENITNQNGGGAWCESSAAILSNCVLAVNSAVNGGGSYSGTLVNCTIKANTANYGGGSYNSILQGCVLSNNTASFSRGGGAFGGFLANCTLVSNSSGYGGGAFSNVLNNCMLTNNSASTSGGGAYACALTNCILSGNFATNGGGAFRGTLAGCILTSNWAGNGGGVYSNTVINCSFVNNTATTNGGGASYATLISCTLSGNRAASYGGGAFYSNLTNCFVYTNTASAGGGMAGGTGSVCIITNNVGGGVYSNTLFNSLVISNFGGSYSSTLNRCWIIGNSQGGSHSDQLNNCVLKYNTGGDGANSSTLINCTVMANGLSSTYYGVRSCNATNCIILGNNPGGNFSINDAMGHFMDHCCTYPAFPGNNITNSPLLLDAIHLQSNSPCIDAGNSSVVVGNVDFDGRPRIVGSAVDIGATEFQGTNAEPFIAWLYRYGLPNDGSADYADSDGTGMNNWQKWIAGLNPTNNLSVLKMISALATNNPNGTAVTWQSVTNVTYYLQRSSDLMSFRSVQSNLVGQPSTTSFTDISATNAGPYFYRVGVQ